MKITSPAFEHDSSIPSLYTCDGENSNPPLEFHDIPSDAKSLVLLMYDPDVPLNLRADGNFDHWVLYNIPPATNAITERIRDSLGTIGINTRGQAKYTGPCPPDREHRYFFELYALECLLDLSPNADRATVEKAMKGHVLEKAELIGKYVRC